MPAVDLLCLANSYKHGHRCVAGLRTDGGGWVRPVSGSEGGELAYRHYKLPGSSEPEVLDVIRVGLARARPQPHHPEDWLIDGSEWQLINRPAPDALAGLLNSSLEPGPWLFRSLTSSIPYSDCVKDPLRASLALIRPRGVKWRTAQFEGRKKARVVFRLSNCWFDLPVTDPMYAARLARLEAGDHDDESISIPAESRYLFTISLAEPWEDGYCYKLVTTVVLLPAAWGTGQLESWRI
jgi:hypothetical protein